MNKDLELVYGYCKNTLIQNDNKLEKLKEQEEYLKNKKQELDAKFQDLNDAEEYYKQAIDILYEESFKNLETKINTFLKKVFDDCHHKIFFTPETSRGNKVVNIELQSGDIISIPSDFGGSLKTVIGLAFRIIYILQTGYPVIFLDETLRDVNDTYTFKLVNFLKELGKNFGIEIVLVTHNEKLGYIGDIHYEVYNHTFNRK